MAEKPKKKKTKATVPDLAGLLARNRALAAAWARGRFLKNLRSLAAAALTVAEAAEALKLEPDQLRQQLTDDPQLRELWNEARLTSLIAVKTALLAEAQKGKAAACRQFEELLRREIVRPATDFRRLTTEQLVEVTGRTRQTLHEWFTRQRMPRNMDKTYSLPDFVNWFEKFVEARFAAEPSARALAAADPLKAVKAENLRLDLGRKRGDLLAREEVLAGLLARYQRFLAGGDSKIEELALLCQGAAAPAIVALLRGWHEELRQGLLTVPAELRLPPAAAEKFAALLAELKAEDDYAA